MKINEINIETRERTIKQIRSLIDNFEPKEKQMDFINLLISFAKNLLAERVHHPSKPNKY